MITIDRAEVGPTTTTPGATRPACGEDPCQPSARSALLRVLRLRPCTVGQLRYLLGDDAIEAFEEAEARGEVVVFEDRSCGGCWRVPILRLTRAGYQAADKARREARGEPVWLVRAEARKANGQRELFGGTRA